MAEGEERKGPGAQCREIPHTTDGGARNPPVHRSEGPVAIHYAKSLPRPRPENAGLEFPPASERVARTSRGSRGCRRRGLALPVGAGGSELVDRKCLCGWIAAIRAGQCPEPETRPGAHVVAHGVRRQFGLFHGIRGFPF